MPEGLELEFFIDGCIDESFNEEQILTRPLGKVILRECFKQHRNFIQTKRHE